MADRNRQSARPKNRLPIKAVARNSTQTTPIPAPPYYQQLATAFNARTTQAMYSGNAKSALDGLQGDLEAIVSSST